MEVIQRELFLSSSDAFWMVTQIECVNRKFIDMLENTFPTYLIPIINTTQSIHPSINRSDKSIMGF